MSERVTQQKKPRGATNATKMNLFLQAVRTAVTPGLRMGQPQWGASRGYWRKGEPHRLVCVKGSEQGDGKLDRVYLIHAFEADARDVTFATFLRRARREFGFTDLRINSVCPGTLSAVVAAGLTAYSSDVSLTLEATLCLPEDYDPAAIDPELERVMCVAAAGALEANGGLTWV